MELGASSNAPTELDMLPLNGPKQEQMDLQTLQGQGVHNRRPGEILPLHAINNLTPRIEFLTSQCFFAKKPT